MVEYFGKSGGTMNQSFSLEDRVRWTWGTATSDGTLADGYIFAANNFIATEFLKFAVYVSSSKVLVAQSSALEGTGVNAVVHASFGPSSITSGTDYLVTIWGDEYDKNVYGESHGDGLLYYRYKNIDYSDNNGDYSNINPFTPTVTDGSAGLRLVIFATYTVSEAGEAGDYTTYTLPIGNPLSYTWNSGQYNIASSMTATSSTPTTFSWFKTSSTSTKYWYKVGSPTSWRWISGSSTIE